MEKESIIEFIMMYSVKANKEELESMSLEALFMIKIQIELELEQQFYN